MALLLFPLLLFAQGGTEPRRSMPALPSEGIIEGLVIESQAAPAGSARIEPGRILSRILLKVEKVSAENGGSEFIRRRLHVGDRVAVYMKDAPEGLAGKRIEAAIVYGGDERGGRFWIRKLVVLDHTGR
jgi:hypothetical protein